MPTAVKLQKEYADDLQVIFVHCQKGTEDQIVRRQLERKWLGNRAMWTEERPFDTPGRGLPAFGLLDAEGKVVLFGSSVGLAKQMEDTIAELVEAGKEAPEDMPKAVGKAFEDMREGDWSKAFVALEKIIEKADEDEAELAGAARQVRDQLLDELRSRLKRFNWMVDHGYPERALDAAEELAKEVKKVSGFHEELTAFLERFDSDEMKLELEAADDLAKLEGKLFESPRDDHRRDFEDFLEDYASTKVAERARFWLPRASA